MDDNEYISHAIVDYIGIAKTVYRLKQGFSLLEFLDFCSLAEGIVLHDQLVAIDPNKPPADWHAKRRPLWKSFPNLRPPRLPRDYDSVLDPLKTYGVLIPEPCNSVPIKPSVEPMIAMGVELNIELMTTLSDGWIESGRLLGAEKEYHCPSLVLLRQMPYYEKSAYAVEDHSICSLIGQYKKLGDALLSLRELSQLPIKPYLTLPIPPIALLVLKHCRDRDDLLPGVLAVRDEFSDLRTSLTLLRQDLADPSTPPTRKLKALNSWKKSWDTLDRYSGDSTRAGLASHTLIDVAESIGGIGLGSMEWGNLLKILADQTGLLFNKWRIRLLHDVAKTYLNTTDAFFFQEIKRVFDYEVSLQDFAKLKAALTSSSGRFPGVAIYSLPILNMQSDDAVASPESDQESFPDPSNSGIIKIGPPRSLPASADIRDYPDVADGFINWWRAAIQLRPGDIGAHAELGRLYCVRGKYDEAIAEFRRVSELDPMNVEAHIGLGRVYRELGRDDEAIAEYQNAAGIDPENVDVSIGLGSAYWDLGRYDEAVIQYQRATMLGPSNAVAHNHLGLLYQVLGRYGEAISEGEQAIKLAPEEAQYHINLGWTYRALNRYVESIGEYQQAIHLDPNNRYAHKYLGQAYREVGRYGEALATYQRAVELDPTNVEVYIGLGDVYLDLQQYAEAMIKYQRAIELDPNNAAAHNHLGRLYQISGRYGEAIIEGEHAIKLAPKEVYYHIDLGWVYRALGRHSESIEEYRQAVSLNPNNSYAHECLGRAYREAGRYDEALATYQRALELDPKSVAAHTGLGGVYRSLGLLGEAFGAYLKANELEPENWFPIYSIGTIHTDTGHPAEAIAAYQRVIELNPSYAYAYIGIAGNSKRLGLLEQAAEYIKKARDLPLDDAGLACLEGISGNADATIEYLRKVVEKHPGDRGWIRQDADFDFIRDDPRFKALIEDSGLF